METSVGKSKKFSLVPEKAIRGPICCCYNYATLGHIGIQIFNFVLSVIIAHHNVLTPHISKTHLPIISFNVRELELN